MNWLHKFLAQLPLIPAIVVGIEQIHGSAVAGATKKNLALQALGLATGVADATLPAPFSAAADTASVAASVVIDEVVKLFNKTAWPGQAAAASLQDTTATATSATVVQPGATAELPPTVHAAR
jgi:hypothetical protein